MTGCTTTSKSRTAIILIYVITLSVVSKMFPSLFVSVNANATDFWNFMQYDISLKIERVCLRIILHFLRGRHSQEGAGNCTVRIFIICIPNQKLLPRSPQEGRHRRVYNTNGGEGKHIQSLVWTPEVKGTLVRPDNK